MNAYTEALADPKAVQIGPDIVIRPFHQQYPATEQDFHVYCSIHSAFGFCGTEGRARQEALRHGLTHERPAVGGTE